MRSVRRMVRLVPRAIVLSVALATSFADAQVPPLEKFCPAGVVWATPVDLGIAATDDVPAAIAAAENGEAMAVWFAPRASGGRMVLSRRFARTTGLSPVWQPAATLRTLPSGADPGAASVAMDSTGNAIAAWETGTDRIEVSRFARAGAGGGQWSNPSVLSAAATIASAPVVALRADGKLALAFWQTLEPKNKRALRWALFETSTGSWSPATTALLADADEDIAPTVAFTPDGYALLTYQYISGVDTPTTDRRVRVLGRWFDPAGRNWSRAAVLSDALGTVTPWATPLVPQPRVTLDGDQQGVAAWRYRDPLGGCESVRAADFDGASKAWLPQALPLGACIDPLPGSSLQPKSSVLAATIAPLNADTTFVLWTQNTTLGATPQVRRRANASSPWDTQVQVPQPVVGHSIAIRDAALAGSSHPSALWVQPRAIDLDVFGLYASNYTVAAAGCPSKWTAAAKITDVTRLQPLLRTPDRAAVPVAVWVDRVGDVPHVFASVRGRAAPTF